MILAPSPLGFGIGLALAVAAFAACVGLDRERSFYPTMLIVIASYYLLFAAMDGSGQIIGGEMVGFLPFALAALIGFRRSRWILVAALWGHGLFDAVHGGLIANSGTPDWWPPFCMAFDVTAGACLAARLARMGRFPQASAEAC